MGLGPASSIRQQSAFAESARLRNYIAKVKGVQTANLIDFWTLNDASGAAVDQIASARNGTYLNSPTLQAATFADGVNKAPSFVAASSQNVNIYSASLDGAFNNAELTLMTWVNMGSTQWNSSNIYYFSMIGTDVNNRVALAKNNTARALIWIYNANATSQIVQVSPASITGWNAMVITVSKANNRMRAYLNGTQQSVNQTGIASWVGALSSSWTFIGRYNTTFYVDGNLAMCALWTKELTAAEVSTISTAP